MTGKDNGGQSPASAASGSGAAPSDPRIDEKLISEAGALLSAVRTLTPGTRRRPLAIATFAAYEATRQPKYGGSRLVLNLYRLFLTFTFLSPLAVILASKAIRPVFWDAVGLGSTMFLLYLTYGVYTWKLLGRAATAFKAMFSDTANTFESISSTLTGTGDSADGDTLEAMFAPVLLILGTLCAIWAAVNLVSLGEIALTAHGHASAHLDELSRLISTSTNSGDAVAELKKVAQSVDDRAVYAASYCRYFTAIWFLSILFIIMDMSVATFNGSHSESYIAASSAAFVTFPMFFGISMVGAYLFFEFVSAWWAGARQPLAALSVEFASGALTFQMMLSNVIFVIMKKNWVFRLFYSAVATSQRP